MNMTKGTRKQTIYALIGLYSSFNGIWRDSNFQQNKGWHALFVKMTDGNIKTNEKYSRPSEEGLDW